MANLMPGEDDWMKGLQGLLGQFGPSEDEKRQAKMAAIAQFGLGLLGAPKGGEFQRVGLSGMNAMNTQQEQLANLRNQKMQGMAAAQQAMGLQEMMRRQQQDAEARQTAADYYKGAQPGAAPAMGGQPPMGAQPPMGGPPPAAGPMAPANDKRAKFEQYMGLSQALAAKGLMDPAEKAAAMAEKFRPKLKDTKTLTQNGQRVTVNFYDDGTTDVVPYGPDQEKAHFLDTGGQVGAVDPFTGKPVAGGGLYNKTVSPDAALSSDTMRRGQNMVDARSREQHQDAQAQAGKPQIVTNPQTGEIFAVDPRNATGQAVMGPDGKPMSKGEKALTEVQGNATAYGMRMKAANDIVNGLEDAGFNTGNPYHLLAGNSATNVMATSRAQQFQQAKLNFMTASLRKESGAAISKSEFETEDKKYFGQPGDSDEVKAQKRSMRELALKAMAKQAGTGAREFNSSSIDDLVKKYAR